MLDQGARAPVRFVHAILTPQLIGGAQSGLRLFGILTYHKVMSKPALLVFSDLDGTLLDHADYSWAAAKPALDLLQKIGAGVVLASSKTASEIRVLQRQIGLTDWPAIVENGAGVLSQDALDTTAYAKIRSAIAQAPHHAHFEGFGDMTAEGVAQVTGLDVESATLAKERLFSEPGLWTGDADKQAAFLGFLADHGITAREGGRFLTLSMGQTKADQMAAIIDTYRPDHTIALGDAPNDVEMLQAADFGVIVANPHRAALSRLPEEARGQIIRTTAPGPMGWNDAVLAYVSQLQLDPNGSSHG